MELPLQFRVALQITIPPPDQPEWFEQGELRTEGNACAWTGSNGQIRNITRRNGENRKTEDTQ
jgi:hypothetical protein